MKTNIFKSKKHELISIIKDVLSESLPQLFKVHMELVKRADPSNQELNCNLEEFAKILGYTDHELSVILKDLLILNFIEYLEEIDNRRLKIKVLVN